MILTFRLLGNSSTEVERVVCDMSCTDHTSCYNCTASGSCIWCNNLSTCVDKNAYVISFPYGQCMSWTQTSSPCHSKDPRSINSNSTSRKLRFDNLWLLSVRGNSAVIQIIF